MIRDAFREVKGQNLSRMCGEISGSSVEPLLGSARSGTLCRVPWVLLILRSLPDAEN